MCRNILFVVLFGLSVSAFSQEENNKLKWGVYASVYGENTWPSYVPSLNVAYELTDNIRLALGAGISVGYTVGIGAKYLFLSDFKVRPFLGFGASVIYTNIRSQLETIFANAIAKAFGSPVTNPDSYPYELLGIFGPSFGIDWKDSSGINLALGGNLWMTQEMNVALRPFVNLGYFF